MKRRTQVPQNPSTPGRRDGRYPAEHTSPWFFIVLASATVLFIVAGIFGFEPVTRFLRWLAVVL